MRVHLLFRVGRHLRFVAALGAELRAELVVVAVRRRGRCLRSMKYSLCGWLCDSGQAYSIISLSSSLRKRGSISRLMFRSATWRSMATRPFSGEYQEIGADVQPVVRDADVHQDRSVRDMELRAVGIAVLGAEFRVQVVEQLIERPEVIALVVLVYGLLVGLHVDLALGRAEDRSDEWVGSFHVVLLWRSPVVGASVL